MSWVLYLLTPFSKMHWRLVMHRCIRWSLEQTCFIEYTSCVPSFTHLNDRVNSLRYLQRFLFIIRVTWRRRSIKPPWIRDRANWLLAVFDRGAEVLLLLPLPLLLLLLLLGFDLWRVIFPFRDRWRVVILHPEMGAETCYALPNYIWFSNSTPPFAQLISIWLADVDLRASNCHSSSAAVDAAQIWKFMEMHLDLNKEY